jgi:hypothetical protein
MKSREQIIGEWLASPHERYRVAAAMAKDLASAERHDRIESNETNAARYGTTVNVARSARFLLMGSGLAYKSGRHFYVA